MTFNDEVEIFSETKEDWGRNSTPIKTGEATGLAQELKAEDARVYRSEGSKSVYQVLFKTDPEITTRNWIRVTSVSLGKTFSAKVLADRVEGRPNGGRRLWIVIAEESTVRGDVTDGV